MGSGTSVGVGTGVGIAVGWGEAVGCGVAVGSRVAVGAGELVAVRLTAVAVKVCPAVAVRDCPVSLRLWAGRAGVFSLVHPLNSENSSDRRTTGTNRRNFSVLNIPELRQNFQKFGQVAY